MKYLKKYRIWLVIIGLELVFSWPVFMNGYFSHHDDLQVMRIYEMRQCFADGQLPCRWVPDMGWGNGYPLFNYYSALPYYIGGVLSFGLGYIGAAKALFLMVMMLGGVTMYLLLRELFGKWPGLVGTVLFVMAPYRALDLYVRGAIAESFAISIVPLVFYLTLKLAKEGTRKWVIGAALGIASFLLCHNIMTLFFMPIILVWLAGWVIFYRRGWWQSLIALGLGGGLAAFFLMPAYLEKALVQTNNLTKLDLDFRAHFVTWKQLFISRFWGYGASNPGPFDGISFQIGWPQWWVVVPVVGFLIWKLPKFRKFNLLIWFWVVVFIGSVVMTHNRSAFIWESLPILWYAQFPWRWLSVTIIACALLGAFLVSRTPVKWQSWLGGGLIVLAVLLNANYFRPEKFFPEVDNQAKLSGQLWEDQRKSSIMDYLPVGAIEPSQPAETTPLIRSGQAMVADYVTRSNNWQFKVVVDQMAEVEVPVYDFAGWQVTANGQAVSHHNDNFLGRISLSLEPGNYLVEGRFTNTPVRTMANLISVASLIILGGLVIYDKAKSKK